MTLPCAGPANILRLGAGNNLWSLLFCAFALLPEYQPWSPLGTKDIVPLALNSKHVSRTHYSFSCNFATHLHISKLCRVSSNPAMVSRAISSALAVLLLVSAVFAKCPFTAEDIKETNFSDVYKECVRTGRRRGGQHLNMGTCRPIVVCASQNITINERGGPFALSTTWPCT